MSDSNAPAPNRWQRLREIYDAAMTMATVNRPQFVIDNCSDDKLLRDELLSLILQTGNVIADNAQTGFIKPTNTQLEPGSIIDRYRIVRHLGEGGMGVVYLAERADSEFRQRVAIKLVNGNLISPNVIARLRGERQILATLNHPNIARLIDGGATRDGVPYLVMEYVEGVRVDLYCSTNGLDIVARLKLFQQICSAVHAAHQQLIIHRDIKPTNVLVDKDGVPKLLDFGIAKLIDADTRNSDTALTLINERMLTPEYASPEQVRGETLGTTSDVYSLGVLLYELLTGLKPYRFMGTTLSQLEQMLNTQAPTRPSVAVVQARISTGAQIDASLPKVLQGDLDTIVMKAMHRDITQRYSSASALAADIDSYLANRPIAARPDGISYIAKKFYTRHRWTVSGAAILLVAITALIAFYTWRLTIERDTAQRERLTATRVSQFMTEVFRVADPDESLGNKVTVREVLDTAVNRVDSELANEPRVRADLLGSMRNAYAGIGLWKESLELARKHVAQERAAFGNNHLELSDSLSSLADCYFTDGNYAEAMKALDEAWSIRERLHKTADYDSALLLEQIGANLNGLGRNDEALIALQKAENLLHSLGDDNADIMVKTLTTRARIQNIMGQYVDAEASTQSAIRAYNAADSSRKPSSLDGAQNELMLALRKLNRYDESERVGRELLAQQQKRFDKDAPIVARTMNNLSHIMRAKGDYPGAEEILQQALAVFTKTVGEQSGDCAISYHNLGALLHESGRNHEAEKILTKALQLKQLLYGADDPVLITTLLDLSLLAAERHRESQSLNYWQRANTIASSKLSDHDPRRSAVALGYGRVMASLEEFQKAEPALREAATIYSNGERIQYSHALFYLGDVMLQQHQACDALPWFKSAVAVRKGFMPASHWMIASAENGLATAMIGCGAPDSGLKLQTESLHKLEASRPQHDWYLDLAYRYRNL